MKSRSSFVVLALAAGVLAACEDSSDRGDVSVFMSRGTVAAAAVELSGSVAGSIPLTSVDSINVRLTAIEAFPTNDSTDIASIDLTTQGARVFNLLNLPALATDSVLIGRDGIAVGTYNNIRLRFDSATITLNQPVTVGNVTYPAGTHELTIPSGLSSGIKVQGATLTITDDAVASINLAFDPTTTVGNIVATGANKLMMSPVIHARVNVNDDDIDD
jgi:hypothetical protein